MSDVNRAPGDPIEENPPVDDVVGRAHEGLADAEAAQRDIVAEPAEPAHRVDPVSVQEQPVSLDEPLDAEHASPAVTEAYSSPAYDAPAVAPSEPLVAPSSSDDAPTEAYRPSTEAYAAPTESYSSGLSRADASAPTEVYGSPGLAADPYAAPAAVAPQPIFVQAPEAPRPRGNRGAAGGIGLIAAVAFAALYLAAYLALGLVTRTIEVNGIVDAALSALTSWWLWITTALFFLAFWLLGAIINTGRWGHWVIWGLLVGVASYGAHLVGQLFQAPFWQLTAAQGRELIETQALAPLAFIALVIGRELTIWFGAWIAARGRRVSELNEEAQREYERTLEAGPQLVRQ